MHDDRLANVLSPDYLADLAKVPMDDLRAMKDECQNLEPEEPTQTETTAPETETQETETETEPTETEPPATETEPTTPDEETLPPDGNGNGNGGAIPPDGNGGGVGPGAVKEKKEKGK